MPRRPGATPIARKTRPALLSPRVAAPGPGAWCSAQRLPPSAPLAAAAPVPEGASAPAPAFALTAPVRPRSPPPSSRDLARAVREADIARAGRPTRPPKRRRRPRRPPRSRRPRPLLPAAKTPTPRPRGATLTPRNSGHRPSGTLRPHARRSGLGPRALGAGRDPLRPLRRWPAWAHALSIKGTGRSLLRPPPLALLVIYRTPWVSLRRHRAAPRPWTVFPARGPILAAPRPGPVRRAAARDRAPGSRTDPRRSASRAWAPGPGSWSRSRDLHALRRARSRLGPLRC